VRVGATQRVDLGRAGWVAGEFEYHTVRRSSCRPICLVVVGLAEPPFEPTSQPLALGRRIASAITADWPSGRSCADSPATGLPKLKYTYEP
jgi:hypothetical protein